ncbi:MAG TPA: hypothetical protein VHV51_08930 [Polyangiaceae bacterium]|nr:hypothetical protein [Polyangiaceae bacterium]
MRFAGLVVLALGMLSAWTNASCSAQNACGGSSGSGGTAGTSAGSGGTNCTDSSASAGTAGATTCSALTGLNACFSAFCQADGAGTPFCGCFSKGFDLGAPETDPTTGATTCPCTPVDPAAFCAAYAGVDGASVDCSAADSVVASMCVGVQ